MKSVLAIVLALSVVIVVLPAQPAQAYSVGEAIAGSAAANGMAEGLVWVFGILVNSARVIYQKVTGAPDQPESKPAETGAEPFQFPVNPDITAPQA